MEKSKDKKNIAVCSGKGGVGKSMVSSSLAIYLSKQNKEIVATDCDVDAPNLAVWLNETGSWDKSEEIQTSDVAVIDKDKCTGCGICEAKCVFKAVEVEDGKAKVSPFTCEGCSRCAVNCPENAITIKPVTNGRINYRQTKYDFPLISGQLYPGETGSGKIVDAVKEKAAQKNAEIMVIDTSPGTGCPVTAALRDTDFALLVTEPSPSGFYDLKKIMKVVNHFRMDYGVIVNKWNLNKDIATKISNWAGDKMWGQISYDKEIVKAIANLKPVLETDLKARKEIEEIFAAKLRKLIS